MKKISVVYGLKVEGPGGGNVGLSFDCLCCRDILYKKVRFSWENDDVREIRVVIICLRKIQYR